MGSFSDAGAGSKGSELSARTRDHLNSFFKSNEYISGAW